MKVSVYHIDDEKILELYQKGLQHKKIADILGYGTSTVTSHLINMGYKSYNINKNEVLKLFHDGLNDKEIADKLGCTRSNITIYLNKMGYKDRHSKKDNLKLRNQISQSLIGKYVGKNNPNYKGYTDEKTIARGIFKTISKRKIRDCNYTCQCCGKHGGDMETHHIKPFRIIFNEFLVNHYSGNINNIYEELINFKDFMDESNMVVLCHECHRKLHYSDNHELSPFRWESATTIESQTTTPIEIFKYDRFINHS